MKTETETETEMLMKNWRRMMAQRLGLSESGVSMRLHRGTLRPKVRRVNARLVYVIAIG